jgi:hypothetical protein
MRCEIPAPITLEDESFRLASLGVRKPRLGSQGRLEMEVD